jgi:retinol dehydrogenase-12
MKTIVMTGGGRGLGRATASQLVGLGHRVILTARNSLSGARAVDEIRALVPDAKIEFRVLDLSSLEQVRAFGKNLAEEGFAVDVLFHCAAIMQRSSMRRMTRDGFEETLAVNALAPFLLTRLMLPALLRSPSARVVNVTSRLHQPGTRGSEVHFDFDDPFLLRGYTPERAYKNSKLALLWLTYEFQRRLAATSISVNAVCPGFVPMTAGEDSAPLQRWFMRHVLVHMPFARSIQEAVESFVFMALDPSLHGVGGAMYAERHRIASSADSYDLMRAKQFWELAEDATGSGLWPDVFFQPFSSRPAEVTLSVSTNM